jgi:hypothetical protein
MKKKIFVLICAAVCFAACSADPKTEQPSSNRAADAAKPSAEARTSATLKTDAANAAAPTIKKDAFSEIKTTKADCLRVDAGDNAILAAQTFPVDFAPFANSCFVTSYNPEYDDPPMESEFAIYQDGKKIFDFPNRFNGVEFGCWVEGVQFEDLNADNLKDIVVAGKCSAKTAPYNENMVYVNTGNEFTTDENANLKLNDFKKIKEITDFARKNQQIFFK